MYSTETRCRFRAGAFLSAASLVILAGCDDDDTTIVKKVQPRQAGHVDVALLDFNGDPLPADSTQPYSPRETCGECHFVDFIANGYHFQQGRTNAAGAVIVKDDFFDQGTAYVRSPGMYGKW